MTGPSGTSTRVAIVENETRYRGFLRTIVEGTPGYECVGAYASADLALAVIATHPPDLLLLDLELPGLQGEHAIPRFLEVLPNLTVVVVTCHKAPERLFPCLEAGAVGYLVKPLDPAELVEALHEVGEGGSPMSGPIARLVLNSFKRRAADRKDLDALTPREVEVLRGIATGSLPEEVGTALGISSRTVQTHLRNIYEKLQVHSRSQAVARFLASTGTIAGS
ncbi:MAG: response regulator transcription factor [Verrucomicrobiales bacterium]|nr:response regulator transcription factor [Verrucomicrobiales bacterium]